MSRPAPAHLLYQRRCLPRKSRRQPEPALVVSRRSVTQLPVALSASSSMLLLPSDDQRCLEQRRSEHSRRLAPSFPATDCPRQTACSSPAKGRRLPLPRIPPACGANSGPAAQPLPPVQKLPAGWVLIKVQSWIHNGTNVTRSFPYAFSPSKTRLSSTGKPGDACTKL